MRRINKVLLRIRSVFSRIRVEQELGDELRFHLEQRLGRTIGFGKVSFEIIEWREQ